MGARFFHKSTGTHACWLALLLQVALPSQVVRIVYCASPPLAKGLQLVTPTDQVFSLGDTAVYNCSRGSGERTAVCQDSGMWKLDGKPCPGDPAGLEVWAMAWFLYSIVQPSSQIRGHTVSLCSGAFLLMFSLHAATCITICTMETPKPQPVLVPATCRDPPQVLSPLFFALV